MKRVNLTSVREFKVESLYQFKGLLAVLLILDLNELCVRVLRVV